MLFSVKINILRRRFRFIYIILSFILITTVIFHQHYIQNFLYTPFVNNIIEENNIDKNEYFARIHQPFSSSILRGILIFYPHDQEDHFLSELLWLYRSWIEMMKDEPLLWRTDLVIYTGNYTLSLRQLGCVYNRIRIDRHESPQCRVFLYERVLARDVKNMYNSGNNFYQQFDIERTLRLITHLRMYPYLDSINIISECYSSYAMYDFILRTDMDVFLTKNFGHFVPYNDTLLVGRGGYSTEFNTVRLRRIAKDMNWSYVNMTNIGSTWYGPSRIAQRIANLSIEAMLHLSMYEFTTPERQGRLGTLLWPEWHYGVLSMYGTHLAVNHLLIAEKFNIKNADELLDQSTTNIDQYDLEINNRLHLHCWHFMEPFSKFQFKAGVYDHLSPNMFINDTSASAFAMRMALESRLMSFSGLKQVLTNVKNSSRF